MKDLNAFVHRAALAQGSPLRAVVRSRCWRCGLAWGAAFLAAIVCVLGGVIALIRGEWLAGAVLIFIMTPIGYGQHVALGMAIDYARGSD